MKRIVIGIFILLITVLLPGSATAFDFEVQSFTFGASHPTFTGATGLHKTIVTGVSAPETDSLKIQVKDGKLFWDGSLCDICGTGWVVINEPGHHEVGCWTSSREEPCTNGVWSSLTVGQVTAGINTLTDTVSGNSISITCF